ncbi:pullulanase [Bacillus aerolatus]|uniref:Pullulanase n=1 Tax=Bacillus aerolatus TaxID=2653354 RepID=A0A6I1FAY4_9BACI|nr:DUF6509 family protein [Bacillus aerolatus]KAB7704231.1 pullulanase [Bacillus aerolatus]
MEITHHTVEKIEDPFGLLTGERFEFQLYANVDEDDELHSESGFYIRVLYLVDGEEEKIIHYHIHDRATGNVLDFELEEEEVELVAAYCRTHT